MKKFLDFSTIQERKQFDWSAQMLWFMDEGTRLKLVLTVTKELDIQDIFSER